MPFHKRAKQYKAKILEMMSVPWEAVRKQVVRRVPFRLNFMLKFASDAARGDGDGIVLLDEHEEGAGWCKPAHRNAHQGDRSGNLRRRERYCASLLSVPSSLT